MKISRSILFAASKKRTTGPVGDPYIDDVLLLANFDSGEFVDEEFFYEESLNGVQCSTYVGTTLDFSSVNANFGSCASFNGSSAAIETVSSVSGMYNVLQATSCTIEMWVYPLSNTLGNIFTIGNGTGSGFDHALLYRNSTGGLMHAVPNSAGNNWQSNVGTNNLLTINNWHHIAFVKNGDNYLTFVNGTLRPEASFTYSGVPYSPATCKIFICRRSNTAGNLFHGKVDSIRVTNNVARYTDSFTIPTLPFVL